MSRLPANPLWAALAALAALLGLGACTHPSDPSDPSGEPTSGEPPPPAAPGWHEAIGHFSFMGMRLGMDAQEARGALEAWLAQVQENAPPEQTVPVGTTWRRAFMPMRQARLHFRVDSGSRLWHYHAWRDAHPGQDLPPVPLSAFLLVGQGKFLLRTEFNGRVRESLHHQAVLTAKFTLAPQPRTAQQPTHLYGLRYAVCPDTDEQLQRIIGWVIGLWGEPMRTSTQGPSTPLGGLLDFSGFGRTDRYQWFFDARGERRPFPENPGRAKSGWLLTMTHKDVHNAREERCPRWDMDVDRKLTITLTDLAQAERDERMRRKYHKTLTPQALHRDIGRLERGWHTVPSNAAFNEYYSYGEVLR